MFIRFAPGAEIQAAADRSIARLEHVYRELKVVDFGPRPHAIYHLGGLRCPPDSRSLLDACKQEVESMTRAA